MNIRKPGYKKGSRGVKTKIKTGKRETKERNGETESENNTVRRRRGTQRRKQTSYMEKKSVENARKNGTRVANTRAERSDGANRHILGHMVVEQQ